MTIHPALRRTWHYAAVHVRRHVAFTVYLMITVGLMAWTAEFMIRLP